MDTEKTSNKDLWDKVKIGAETAIAVGQFAIAAVGLYFAVSYNEKSQQMAKANLELADSNTKIAQAQLKIAEAQSKSALIPPLSNGDPKQRAIALYLAEAQDPAFAVEVARIYSLNDPNQEVRKTAKATLGSLARNAAEGVKQQAEKGLDQNDIMSELRAKSLLEKLNQARGYQAGGGLSGDDNAVRLYHEVASQLSRDARKKLDQKLLDEAEKAFNEGHRDGALRKYSALFADYR